MSGNEFTTEALLVRLRELERENAELREMLGLGQPVRQHDAVPSMREADPARLAPTRQGSAMQAPAKQDPAAQTITKFSPPELKIALFRSLFRGQAIRAISGSMGVSCVCT